MTSDEKIEFPSRPHHTPGQRAFFAGPGGRGKTRTRRKERGRREEEYRMDEVSRDFVG
jgi:hypothetical protein